MPIILRMVHTKYDLNRTQGKIVIYITLWFAMVTKLPWQQGMSLMSIVLRKLNTKYDHNRTQDKRVIYVTLMLPRYVTDAYCPKEAPCQI